MDSSLELGIEAEKRFFKLFSAKSPQQPWWFKKIEGTSPSMDVRGVDAIAILQDIDGIKDIKVPLQIKSSRSGTMEYLSKKPDALSAGLIVVIVNDLRSDDDIREYVFGRLRMIHEGTIRFDNFFKKLFDNSLSLRAQRLIENAGTKKHMQDRPKK